jgi:hypothetical protein
VNGNRGARFRDHRRPVSEAPTYRSRDETYLAKIQEELMAGEVTHINSSFDAKEAAEWLIVP